jgi:hypothetical protein
MRLIAANDAALAAIHIHHPLSLDALSLPKSLTRATSSAWRQRL